MSDSANCVTSHYLEMHHSVMCPLFHQLIQTSQSACTEEGLAESDTINAFLDALAKEDELHLFLDIHDGLIRVIAREQGMVATTKLTKRHVLGKA